MTIIYKVKNKYNVYTFKVLSKYLYYLLFSFYSLLFQNFVVHLQPH